MAGRSNIPRKADHVAIGRRRGSGSALSNGSRKVMYQCSMEGGGASMVHGGRGINGLWGEEGHQWSMEGGGASMAHRGRRGINGPWGGGHQ